MTHKPVALSVNAGGIPVALQAIPRWVVWRFDWDSRREEWAKVPYAAGGPGKASTTNPTTWRPFGQALATYQAGGFDGIGIVLHREESDTGPGLIGIDIDDCREAESVSQTAIDIVRQIDSYTEMTPSGAGLRIFAFGRLSFAGRRKGPVEVYQSGRYLTVTGQSVDWASTAIEMRQPQLTAFAEAWFPAATKKPLGTNGVLPHPSGLSLNLADSELLNTAFHASNGPSVKALFEGDIAAYPSLSEADLALCNHLAFYCGADADRIDRLFRGSALFRGKWERADYRQRTIAKALEGRTEFYGQTNGVHLVLSPPPPPDLSLDDVATIADLRAAGAAMTWLWPQWIPLGVLTAIAAPGGTGKTRFCADLLRRIRYGLPWPDGQPMLAPFTALVLWVVADNHHDEMVSLAEQFGIEGGIRINASKSDPYGGVTLETQEDLDWLEARIKAVRPLLVVIDTVGNATDKNLSKQEDAKAFYFPLQILARKYRCAILTLTHLNATGQFLGRRVLEKVRVAIKMEQPDKDDPKRRLEVAKTNAKPPAPLGLTMGDQGNDYDANPPEPADDDGSFGRKIGKKLAEVVDWLKSYLEAGPRRVSYTINEAKSKGFSVGTLYRAKDSCSVDEYESEGYKWWRLTTEDSERAF